MDIQWKILIVYLILVNIAGFLSMGIDKHKAKKGQWRIPEKTLFLIAAIGGSIGSMYGMHLFRHKTKHKSFVYGMPAILIMQLLMAICIFWNFVNVPS